MKKIFLLFITVAILSPVMAQDAKENTKSKKEQRKLRISEIAKQEEEGVIKYKKHTAFGAKLITDGYGAFIEVSKAQSVKRSLLFQLEFSERKHKKEEKQSNPYDYYGTTNPLIYGKQNFFYPIKLGVQQQFLLGNKGNRSGVGVTANGGGGFVAGILRPYMPEVIKDGQREYVYYFNDVEKENSISNDTTVALIGGPGFGTGWNKLKFTPGLYAKLGIRFDFGKYNEMLNAIEVGISEEYYIKEIPQMAYNPQKQFFFSAYVAIMFGKRK
jgi:hypothetical protein